jgi:xanthine dehydrogenase accessory factor
VFIFVAGHVSRELARVAAFAGFEWVVLDERDEFADARFFPDAGRVLVVPGFARAFDYIDVTPESYLVIVTRGHLDDQVVLEGALRTDAAYIGMIGSRRKRALIDQTLLQKGFSAADIARVCSPVGLPIGAETPEEIAISITAQLIAARAAQRGE